MEQAELLAHYGRKMAHVVNMYNREIPGYHVDQEMSPEEGERILTRATAEKRGEDWKLELGNAERAPIEHPKGDPGSTGQGTRNAEEGIAEADEAEPEVEDPHYP